MSNDDIYGTGSTPEFKPCMVCGVVDCTIHKDNPVNGATELTEEQREAMAKAASEVTQIFGTDVLKAFGDDTGADIDEALQAINNKTSAIIHTGKKNEYSTAPTEDDEDEDGAGDEDGEEHDEDEDEDDGTVKFTQLPPPISVMGGSLIGRKGEDKDKSTAGGHFYHLDNVQDQMTTSAWKGQPHNFRLFRAKKDILPDRFKVIEAEAKNHVPRLKQCLYLALEAEARVARQRNLNAGAVDAGQLSKLVTDGSENVFAKKANRKDISTAVVIILDDSSSMQEIANRGSMATGGIAYMSAKNYLWTKAGAAAVMTIALGEVMTQLNIPFAVYSYEGGICSPFQKGEGGYKVADNYGGHFAIQYKGFSESWQIVKGRMGAYLPSAGSYTYEAAAFAGNLLLGRKEERKILFHLSDAQLGNQGIMDLPKLVERMEKKAGIRYVGFGLLEDCFKKVLKDKAECIERIEDLNDKVFKRLADLIHPKP